MTHRLTLRRALRKPLITIVGLAVGIAAGLVVAVFLYDSRQTEMVPPAEPTASTNPASELLERLIERHDCWTGPAPTDMEGRIPGHAIVTWPGTDRPVYGGRHAVDAALEHQFGKRQLPGLIVHAFCR